MDRSSRPTSLSQRVDRWAAGWRTRDTPAPDRTPAGTAQPASRPSSHWRACCHRARCCPFRRRAAADSVQWTGWRCGRRDRPRACSAPVQGTSAPSRPRHPSRSWRVRRRRTHRARGRPRESSSASRASARSPVASDRDVKNRACPSRWSRRAGRDIARCAARSPARRRPPDSAPDAPHCQRARRNNRAHPRRCS